MDYIDAFFDGMYQNPFSDWLLEDDWNERKYQQFTLLYSVPFVHDYMDALLDHRYGQEYLNRYGMDYTDIHDPRRLSGTSSGSAAVRSGYRMISSNISKLYR